MIRDMELLLNTVYDDEIKSYLREALNCYSAEAYRACVIMSIIGGIHDLHNKLKILAPSNHDIADLEKKVSDSKEKLNPYERLLVDGCARSDIDLLTPSEAKEINRCFDIRNDCAHPSDYNCTAETARYVYSTIIDILLDDTTRKYISLDDKNQYLIMGRKSTNLFITKENLFELISANVGK